MNDGVFFHTYVSLLEANVEQETFDEPRDEASPETWWIKLQTHRWTGCDLKFTDIGMLSIVIQSDPDLTVPGMKYA